MSDYKLVPGGVIYAPTNSFIAENSNDDWNLYLSWLAAGNTPDPDVTLTNAYKYKEALVLLAAQYAEDVNKLQSNWLSAAVLGGTTETTKKASVTSAVTARKTQYLSDTLEQFGKQTYIHTIITGGQAKDDTANGLLSLIDMVKESGTKTQIVVWQNDFWGKPLFDGKPLEDMPWIKKNHDIIKGIITIIDRNSDAFSTDIKIMTENHMTFNEVKQSEEFGLLARSRIHRVFNDIYAQLDSIFDSENTEVHG